MRSTPFVVVVIFGFVTVCARADLGPPPSCEGGSHQEYLYGHHCVADGYHLSAGKDGKILTVKDGSESAPDQPTAPATTTASTSATTSGTTSSAPTPVATSTSVAAPPPAPTPAKKSGCVYGAGARTDDVATLAMVAAALALSTSRRKSVMAFPRARD